ncbi:hypothetical protein CR513_05144, partial [Mucuna pruriens]
MDDLVYKATRVESQQKRCMTSKKAYHNDLSSWRGKEKKKDWPRKDKSLKKGSFPPQGRKEERVVLVPISASKSSNIKYFKCLGKGSWNESSSISEEDSSCDYLPNEDDLLIV